MVTVIVLGAAAALVALLLAVGYRRRSRELAATRAQVERLAEQVERLSDDVERNRAGREAAEETRAELARQAERNREYVITSLAQVSDEVEDGVAVPPPWSAVASSRLADSVGERIGRGERSGDLLIRGLAWGHGVRVALSADVRDRARAAAHLERRRSRRERRDELRAAKRLVRAVRTQRRQDAA